MRPLLAAAAIAVLAGCGGYGSHADTPIKDRYRVSEQASPECIDAAKRASKWCVSGDTISNTDTTWTKNCEEARWDYHRLCS